MTYVARPWLRYFTLLIVAMGAPYYAHCITGTNAPVEDRQNERVSLKSDESGASFKFTGLAALITAIGGALAALITALAALITAINTNKKSRQNAKLVEELAENLKGKLEKGAGFKSYLGAELENDPYYIEKIRRLGTFVAVEGAPGTNTFEKLLNEGIGTALAPHGNIHKGVKELFEMHERIYETRISMLRDQINALASRLSIKEALNEKQRDELDFISKLHPGDIDGFRRF